VACFALDVFVAHGRCHARNRHGGKTFNRFCNGLELGCDDVAVGETAGRTKFFTSGCVAEAAGGLVRVGSNIPSRCAADRVAAGVGWVVGCVGGSAKGLGRCGSYAVHFRPLVAVGTGHTCVEVAKGCFFIVGVRYDIDPVTDKLGAGTEVATPAEVDRLHLRLGCHGVALLCGGRFVHFVCSYIHTCLIDRVGDTTGDTGDVAFSHFHEGHATTTQCVTFHGFYADHRSLVGTVNVNDINTGNSRVEFRNVERAEDADRVVARSGHVAVGAALVTGGAAGS